MQHSWTFILRPLCLALAALGVTGAAEAELGNAGSNSAACCQLTTSLVNDVLRGEDVSGDERFFATDGTPPNIHFLIDASGSMQELPQILNSNHKQFFDETYSGCINPSLDAFQASHGWDPAVVYPVPDPGTGLGGDTGFPLLFQDDKFYGYMSWNYSTSPPPTWGSQEAACQSQVSNWDSTNAPEYARCLSCLSTKGYFKSSSLKYNPDTPSNDAFILWGRFLNFNPPKYVTARSVLKSVLKDLTRVRVSMSHFQGNSPYSRLIQPAELPARTNPSCTEVIEDASAFESQREHYIDAINELQFSTGTPLARSLLNAGYYFTSSKELYRDVFGFGAGYSYPLMFENEPLTSQSRSVCWGCQSSSIIIVTDGEPTVDGLSSTVATRLRELNGGPVYCPDSAPCGPGPLNKRDKGTNGDPMATGDDNPDYYLDDVAKLLHEQDLQRSNPPQIGDFNTEGKQSVNVYTVGFGIKSNLLMHAAEVGGGLYYSADDREGLKEALLSIIGDVVTRATSFSSPAAASMQVRAAGATLIPRFKPARSATEPWQGFLYRFNMGPEILLGCDPASPSSGGDLNGDGDCNDTHLVDADGDAVTENDEGAFVKLRSPLTPARPFWEAGEKLRPANALHPTRWKTRRIYTIVDGNGDGRVDFRDTPVEFSEANAPLLREYLGISQNPAACSELAARMGVVSLSPDDCARAVIRWYRGADVLNPDPALRDDDRPFLLHDLFHSAPVPLEPPTQPKLCGFDASCLQALIHGDTPQQNDYVVGTDTGARAYDKYVYEAGDRDRVVLVGSNGGMLHAFHNGRSTGHVDTFTGQYTYDEGTGEELWAFIPPDLLPKLRPNIGKHAYFVDNSPMVREVWLDGTGGEPADGQKQWKEFRKVAVVGTGRGGVHRFALDVTRLLGTVPGESQARVPDTLGDFLWMWPQPCDALALQVGESFSNFSPKPSPIGPVALSPEADDAVRALYQLGATGIADPWLVSNQPARERWVVGLNGGFDQSMTRGRGFAIVDIRTGHTLWSFFHGDGQPNSEHLRYPIGAGLSLFDLGKTEQGDATANLNSLWDSGTVGDYGGQVWMLRMYNPGTWNAATQRVDNWYAARAFRAANTGGKSADEEAVRAPITFQTLNAVQPGGSNALRVFVGTGDRENLLEKGSVCRLSNPLACAAQGCAVSTTLTVQRGGATALTSSAHFEDFRYTSGGVSSNTAGPACGGAQVTLTWNNDAQNGCGNGHDGSLQYTCDGDASTWSCRETANTWTQLNYAKPNPAHPQRFYGFRAFAQVAHRTFDDAAGAQAFDAQRLTDEDLTVLVGFDAATGKVTGTQQPVDVDSEGWRLEYAATHERTGTSGTLLNGCVLWSSFEPGAAAEAVCSAAGTHVARLYQAHFATGMASCALGFYDDAGQSWSRFTRMNTVAAPPEPTPQISIGGGEIITTVNLQGPGVQQSQTVTQNDEGVKTLFQLEVDARAHNCRHLGIDCN